MSRRCGTVATVQPDVKIQHGSEGAVDTIFLPNSHGSGIHCCNFERYVPLLEIHPFEKLNHDDGRNGYEIFCICFCNENLHHLSHPSPSSSHLLLPRSHSVLEFVWQQAETYLVKDDFELKKESL